MPKRKIIDRRSDRESYGEGKKESKRAGLWNDIKKSVGDTFDKRINDTRSPQEKAYDAGWEDGKKLRSKYKKQSRSQRGVGSSGGSGSGGCFGFVVVFVILAVLGLLCIYTTVR